MSSPSPISGERSCGVAIMSSGVRYFSTSCGIGKTKQLLYLILVVVVHPQIGKDKKRGTPTFKVH
jgi:hypothetical protein